MTSPNPAPDTLPEDLSKGYRAFWTGRLREEKDRFRHLSKHGQHPPTLFIGCCDSRVAPEVIFGAGPGEIFVIRNIANLVPPFEENTSLPETAAAIEYAVIALEVAHIVVMGHAQCGGIRAYAQGEIGDFKPLSESNFIGHWKSLIAPAAETLGAPAEDFDHHCESLCHASIVQGLANLRTYPWVRERENAGKLALHGAYFGVADGSLMALDRATGSFVEIVTT